MWRNTTCGRDEEYDNKKIILYLKDEINLYFSAHLPSDVYYIQFKLKKAYAFCSDGAEFLQNVEVNQP